MKQIGGGQKQAPGGGMSTGGNPSRQPPLEGNPPQIPQTPNQGAGMPPPPGGQPGRVSGIPDIQGLMDKVLGPAPQAPVMGGPEMNNAGIYAQRMGIPVEQAHQILNNWRDYAGKKHQFMQMMAQRGFSLQDQGFQNKQEQGKSAYDQDAWAAQNGFAPNGSEYNWDTGQKHYVISSDPNAKNNWEQITPEEMAAHQRAQQMQAQGRTTTAQQGIYAGQNGGPNGAGLMGQLMQTFGGANAQNWQNDPTLSSYAHSFNHLATNNPREQQPSNGGGQMPSQGPAGGGYGVGGGGGDAGAPQIPQTPPNPQQPPAPPQNPNPALPPNYGGGFVPMGRSPLPGGGGVSGFPSLGSLGGGVQGLLSGIKNNPMPQLPGSGSKGSILGLGNNKMLGGPAPGGSGGSTPPSGGF